jgi:nucleotide-binding universal stress UspA family protein
MAVVVGFLPTPEGRAALRHAGRERRLRDAELVVVRSDLGGKAVDPAETERTEQVLREVTADVDAQGRTVRTREPARGADSAEDVIFVAIEEAAEVIVIGLRRRSPVGKLVLGSHAQRILLDAPCPVLAVKADLGD